VQRITTIARVTSAQLGVFTRRQAYEAGISRHQLLRAAREGELVRPHPSVIVHRVILPPEHVVRVGALCVTTPARTVADVTGIRTAARLARLVDEVVVGGFATLEEIEARVYRAIVNADLPAPRQQHWVSTGGERFRLDLAYPDRLLGIEYQGFDAHRTRGAFDRDFRRDRLLTEAGWTILYFTAADDDEEIARTVGSCISQR